jgi:hypothetical protein
MLMADANFSKYSGFCINMSNGKRRKVAVSVGEKNALSPTNIT